MQFFIDKQEICNTVILGCGLETIYDHMRRKKAQFYEMDLPEVIEGSRKVLGERENERSLYSTRSTALVSNMRKGMSKRQEMIPP